MSEVTSFSSRLRFRAAAGKVTVRDAGAPADTAPPGLDEQFPEAYQAGVAAGEQRARGELERLLQQQQRQTAELQTALQRVQQELPVEVNAYLEQLEHVLFERARDAAFTIAEHLVRREIERRSPVEELVRAALAEHLHLSGVTLYVAPQDAELLPAAATTGDGMKVVPDAGLGPGEIRLEADQGFLDGRVAARLERLRRRLQQGIDEEPTDGDHNQDT